MKTHQNWLQRLCCLAALGMAVATPAFSQTALEGKYLSALAPENLGKRRPKASFDLTGTWVMEIDPASGAHLFEPKPVLAPETQKIWQTTEDYSKKGLEYRDDPGACWPLGMPRIMTRFWPIQIIQLPTMIVLTTMFNNSARWIYMDGRGHPPDEEMVYTFNGHSIGKWEGNTLVVDTVGFTGDHHYVQEGVPTGEKLHITERIRLLSDGKTIEIKFIMTDPEHWVGEWVNTKRYKRQDYSDIEEHVCIYEQMSKLPSFKFNIRE